MVTILQFYFIKQQAPKCMHLFCILFFVLKGTTIKHSFTILWSFYDTFALICFRFFFILFYYLHIHSKYLHMLVCVCVRNIVVLYITLALYIFLYIFFYIYSLKWQCTLNGVPHKSHQLKNIFNICTTISRVFLFFFLYTNELKSMQQQFNKRVCLKSQTGLNTTTVLCLPRTLTI